MALKKWKANFHLANSVQKKQDYLFRCSVVPGNFLLNDPKSRVPFTFQPVFPENLGKWTWIDPGFPNKRRTKIGMPSMPGMGRHEIQLSQKISMPGMPAMKTKFVPRLPRLSKCKIIRAQATLGAWRCLSVHPKLRYTGHSNFPCMPLKTFNSQSSPF